MARTYLSGDNSRGNLVTAANAKFSHLRGWHAGVEVDAFVDDQDRDVFQVYMTHGSNGGGSRNYIGSVVDTEDGPKWVTA